MNRSINIFIVDDEAPARARLRCLLDDCRETLPNSVIGEASCGHDALQALGSRDVDVVLLDIDMPGMDGVNCARELVRRPNPPAVVFVTAHNEYAIAAFDLGAVDYLLKPVRLVRLEESLKRVLKLTQGDDAEPMPVDQRRRNITVNDRGRVYRIPVRDVLYLRAELKYVTLRTVTQEHVLTDSLNQLEQDFLQDFVRIHRNCLVNRIHLKGFELRHENAEDRWFAVLRDWPERLPVSRRQTFVVQAYRNG